MSKVFERFSWPKAAFFTLIILIALLVFLPATGERIITVVTDLSRIFADAIRGGLE
ncbi:MAG: hypothetical protein QQN63_00505 [Nitrosopumilus sp.]